MTLQHPGDFDFETGLEDFTQDDAVTPRLSIQHKEGTFKDSLSGQEFEKLTCIMLGLVKQRILWYHQVDDNSKNEYPMCRSLNHEYGFPNLDEEVPKSKQFPWERSGFNPANFTPDDEGLIRLPCESCKLKDWGSHPDGNKPYCAEQFTTPVLYDPNGDGSTWVPAILSFQKTSLKPLKAYFTGFQRAKNAAFMAYTEITLDLTKRGTNVYSIPQFRKLGDTDEQLWRGFSAQYRQLRDFLQADPGVEDIAPSGEVPPTPGPAPTPAATPAPGTVDHEGIEEAQVVEDPPAQEPATPAAPAAPTAPAAPSVPTPPPAPSAPAAPAAAVVEDEDDLPF
jgi:hypothetical protein